MKKTFSIVLAIWMVISMIACGKNASVDKDEIPEGKEDGSVIDTNVDEESQPNEPNDNENDPPKERKEYTLLWIPVVFIDEPGEGSATMPKSLMENVTLYQKAEEDVCTSFGYDVTKIENADAALEKTITLDGKTYELTLAFSESNEWSVNESPSISKFAYYDSYKYDDTNGEVTFNSTTGRLSFFFENVNTSAQGNVGEQVISQKADRLLLELYGQEYLDRYTKTVEYSKRGPDWYVYTVVYRRDFGKYLGDDMVIFRFSPKGELQSINAKNLDLLAEYDFTQEQLDAAKEAMYSAIYSDPGQWPGGDIRLTIDGLTGTCYMETYVFNYNGKDVEWRLLMALD